MLCSQGCSCIFAQPVPVTFSLVSKEFTKNRVMGVCVPSLTFLHSDSFELNLLLQMVHSCKAMRQLNQIHLQRRQVIVLSVADHRIYK